MRATRLVLSPILLAAVLPAQLALHTSLGTVAGGELGRVVRGVGDADGDGVGDFLVSQPETQTALPGRALLISGRTRGTLATFVGAPPGQNFRGFGYHEASPVGDLDGDGRTDLAIGYSGGYSVLDVFSGGSGARLYRLGAPAPEQFPFACAAGDIDGDGRDDLVTAVHLASGDQLWLRRGTNGLQLGTVTASIPVPGPLRSLGDVTGNGRPDVACLCDNNNQVRVFQTVPPLQVALIPRPPGAAVFRRLEAADMTGDGRAEVLVSDDQRVYVFAATNGALLRSYTLPGLASFGGWFAVVGDLDADGLPELALPTPAQPWGEVVFLSGRDGRRIAVWSGSPQFPCGSLPIAGIGDVDGDGAGDLVLGAPWLGANAGGWQVLSGRIVAGMRFLPVQCTGGPFPPQLGLTRPVLGQAVTIVGRDCPPAAAGALALSAQPPAPANLGASGCDAWFDLGNWLVLHAPPPGSTWTHTVPLPGAPQLAGLEVALQAFYLPTNGPLGYDLSNGIWARLGW